MNNTLNKDFSEKLGVLLNKKYSKADKVKIVCSSIIGILICLITSFIVNASLAEISFNPIFSLVFYLFSKNTFSYIFN